MSRFNRSGSVRVTRLGALAAALALSLPALGQMVITPTFTTNFTSLFGGSATAAENAWIAAANVFTSHFSDNIHVNITVDAVAGTGVFGQSNFPILSTPYANLHSLLLADSKTANDAIALGPGGSISATDPTGGSGTWWVSRAEAKAIGLIGDDLSNDGKTTFGAGNPFTFSGPITVGTYDFQGVAAHEISEVLGRLGISGGTIGSFANSYSAIDLFSYTGAGTRGLGNGAGNNFSINNGTTLLKLYNNAASNGLDSRDWAPGSNDSFNQFSASGVINAVSPVDLQELDVIGYDLIPVPEPTSGALLAVGLTIVLLRRRQAASPTA